MNQLWKRLGAVGAASALTLFMAGLTAPAVNAHGGGLDWQGGHNCRVGSCAGTYHCHQPRGGICLGAKPKATRR